MKRLAIGLLLASLSSPAFAGVNEDTVQEVLNGYVPEHMGIAPPAVKQVKINNKTNTITISLSESAAYLPLTLNEVTSLKSEAKVALGSKYAKYKVSMTADGFSLEQLACDATRSYVAPQKPAPFVKRLDAAPAPAGMDGANIALWQSHGWYFEPKLNRWEWQRARIMQTVEDLYTQSYVMPYLMPMLENAGAYVMSPRERDIRCQELIIDHDIHNSGYSEDGGGWSQSDKPGFSHTGQLLKENENPFKAGHYRRHKASDNCKACWSANLPEEGSYAVYVSYATEPNSATDATYTVHAANGDHVVVVNQKMGGGTWVYIGHYPFCCGKHRAVTLSTHSANSNAVVTADAVKIGGGIGNVARIVKNQDPEIDYEYQSSGYPRFTEGARYWLQWAGAPEEVYTPSDNENDYTDDYRSRGLWVNWMAGGSSVLPKEEGLHVPIDLAMAFHSDAGTTPNDSIIGTLGIYCTDKTDKYANGNPRLAARDLTNAIMTEIVSDIRANFEPNWMRRGMWNKNYAEARVPQVPTMLLELLSHQNFADMKYGLDPAFRFAVSRAIYKGMLKYLAKRDGRAYTVEPLPVKAFAINGGDGKYTLSWQPTPDPSEPSAMPSYYIIEERKAGDVGFTPIAKVNGTTYDVAVKDHDIHSYRVIAANDGGTAFPGEVLALCHKPGSKQALIVNGFTRISGPDTFDFGNVAGFYDMRDHGVPLINDISFIGSQYEFRRAVPWMDDDAAGFGASRSNYETCVIAGNTFDFVALHGQAMADCGVGFISSSVEAFASSDVAKAPKTLDLILGKQKEIKVGTSKVGKFKTFPSALKEAIKQYANNGGNVMVTGSFLATDLWDNPHSSEDVMKADKQFAADVLGYNWRVGQAEVSGKLKEVKSKFKAFDNGEFAYFNELCPEHYAVESPDALYPANDKGATIMRFAENNLPAGTAYSPGLYRTVCLGVPFESIKDADSRTALMKQILTFFNQK